MNIFIYLRQFPSREDLPFDGAAKSVHGLASGLAAAGARVEILAEAQISSYRPSPFGYVVRVFASKSSSSPRRFVVNDELVRFVAQLKSTDLLLLNGVFSPYLATIGRAARKSGSRYIMVPHDPYNAALFAKSAWLKRPYWHLYEKPLLDHALAIQLLDRRHADFLLRRGVRVPMFEVPNGFEPSDADSIIPKPPRTLGDASIQFYFLGRIDPFNKGLDLLIKAFANFAPGKAVQLTLQGPNHEGSAAALTHLARTLGMSDRVGVLPPDYDRRSPELIAGYDMFCLPSRYEGFGLAALEAMLAERAVLVSNVAGIAPHVARSEAGLVVEPTQEGICRGLELSWRRREEWTSMGARGRQHVLKELSWAAISRRAIAEYHSLLAKV
jgi:glycosyltransferase involved in cell wall biosynthesis